MISTTSAIRGLNTVIKYNKIVFKNGNPYNLRWQWKLRSGFYTYPKDDYDSTYVKKPEDSPKVRPLYYTYWQDLCYRFFPTAKLYWERRHRYMDPFQIYVLPTFSLFSYQFWDVSFGFKVFTIMPLAIFYIRMRDKSLDPEIKQTFLRDMIHGNPEISALFKPETIHILDHDMEYDQGYPDTTKLPEYQSKLWRFFNVDGMFITGFFKFGDVESGATMLLKFKTLPVRGPYRYQVGEPYYLYDVRAQITHNGTFKQVVLADEKVELKKHKPFLFLM